MPAKYYIYRNLHLKDTFSVRHRGIVIGRYQNLIAEGVTFVVNEAGRQRVLTEGRKNVHAFVCAEHLIPTDRVSPGLTRVSYNPRRGPSFMANDQPITQAKAVHFQGGSCYLVE
jgi:hypothetical protein